MIATLLIGLREGLEAALAKEWRRRLCTCDDAQTALTLVERFYDARMEMAA